MSQMTAPGTPYEVIQSSAPTFADYDDNAADCFTPSGKTYIADLTVGVNFAGFACFANALVSTS
jgi:hypothetical protein